MLTTYLSFYRWGFLVVAVVAIGCSGGNQVSCPANPPPVRPRCRRPARRAGRRGSANCEYGDDPSYDCNTVAYCDRRALVHGGPQRTGLPDHPADRVPSIVRRSIGQRLRFDAHHVATPKAAARVPRRASPAPRQRRRVARPRDRAPGRPVPPPARPGAAGLRRGRHAVRVRDLAAGPVHRVRPGGRGSSRRKKSARRTRALKSGPCRDGTLVWRGARSPRARCWPLGCHHRLAPVAPPPAPPVVAKPTRPPIPKLAALPALGAGETWAYDRGVARKMTIEAARAAGLLDVDLGDELGAVHPAGRRAATRPSRTTTARRSSRWPTTSWRRTGSRPARGATTFSRCSGSRRRCRCSRRAWRRTWRPRARPASTPSIARGSSSSRATWGSSTAIGPSATTSRRCTTPTGSRRRRPRGPGRRRSRSPATGAGAAARGSQGARAGRSLPARKVAPAGGARGAGAPHLRGDAVAEEPLHGRQLRSADARGARDVGAQARHLRVGPSRRRDAGDAAGPHAVAAARRLSARAGRAGRRRGGNRRGRFDQSGAQEEPAHLARRRGGRAPGPRSHRRPRQRAPDRPRRPDAGAGGRLPARAEGRSRRRCTSPSSRPRSLPTTATGRTWT